MNASGKMMLIGASLSGKKMKKYISDIKNSRINEYE